VIHPTLATMVSLLLTVPLQAARAVDFSKDCSEVVVTEVDVSDELRPGETMATTRARVILMASQSALRQTIGDRISAKSSFELHTHNKDIDERLYNRIRSQSDGFVKQETGNETIVKDSGHDMLQLKTKASVCIPKTPLVVKEVVRIGPTLNAKDQELPEFRSVVMDAFSGSRNYSVSDDRDAEIDLEVNGKITRIEWSDVGRTVPPDFLVGRDGTSSSPPIKFQRLSVGVTVSAKLLEDGTTVTSSLSRVKNFPVSADPALVAPVYVREVLRLAVDELQEKIRGSKSNGQTEGGRVSGKTRQEW